MMFHHTITVVLLFIIAAGSQSILSDKLDFRSILSEKLHSQSIVANKHHSRIADNFDFKSSATHKFEFQSSSLTSNVERLLAGGKKLIDHKGTRHHGDYPRGTARGQDSDYDYRDDGKGKKTVNRHGGERKRRHGGERKRRRYPTNAIKYPTNAIKYPTHGYSKYPSHGYSKYPTHGYSSSSEYRNDPLFVSCHGQKKNSANHNGYYCPPPPSPAPTLSSMPSVSAPSGFQCMDDDAACAALPECMAVDCVCFAFNCVTNDSLRFSLAWEGQGKFHVAISLLFCFIKR